MDATILFFLPLIAGYTFCQIWQVTRYMTLRESGHKLYFRAAFYGFFIYSVSALLILCHIFRHDFGIDVEAFNGWSGIDIDLFDFAVDGGQFIFVTTALTIPIAVLLGVVFSLPISWVPVLNRTVTSWSVRHDDFESLLSRAFATFLPVCVSMENSKAYVGFVSSGPDPASQRRFISLFPVLSGFRDSTGRLEFTTDYELVYAELMREIEETDSEDASVDFALVLPIERIQSINLFDFDVYIKFQSSHSEDSEEKQPPDDLAPSAHTAASSSNPNTPESSAE